MSTDPNPTPSSSSSRVRVSGMEDDSSLWDWGDLLDFNLDDANPLILPWDSPDHQQQPPPPPTSPPAPLPEAPAEDKGSPAQGSLGRVRKRDPRLVCENFLAGRVPCACPEVDEMMLREEAEEEAIAGGKKRVRVRTAKEATTTVALRCQVPGCEVDIKELKGYHRRHRVCLRCANASSVMIDREDKRYCQQCGKFHTLPDFDEGKRSCRRKLERHNRRRRRRPTGIVNIAENKKGPRANLSTEPTCDEEKEEENEFDCEAVLSSKVNDIEVLLGSDDGHGSPICSDPHSQNMQSNSIMSFVVPGEAHIDEEKNNSKSVLSSTICENRSCYSSSCPTGRISFKLYDWNPAEFPRRLRHQIFQWLSSMPVELEGYVRPGCTILTIFIAMPQFMWEKLSKDATLYIQDLINAPESLLLGRGNIFIFLSNMIIQVLKDGSSLMNVRMEVKAPRIHYVYPTYFEAGKPMEFVVCGSSLNQPKFRFLVSFAGKYMVYDSCRAICHGKDMPCDRNKENFCHETDHEMFMIHISQTDSRISGPAFVEVENESGISNFIPIVICNKHICSELERMQEAPNGSITESSQISIFGANPRSCELFVAKRTAESELLVDIAWLLKEPCRDGSGAIFHSMNLQRLTGLLQISIQNELFNVLQAILNYLDATLCNVEIQDADCLTPDADLKLLQGYVQSAREILSHRHVHGAGSELDGSLKQEDILPQTYDVGVQTQDEMPTNGDCCCSTIASTSRQSEENIHLVGGAMVDRERCYPHHRANWPRGSLANSFPRTITGARLAVLVMVSVAMCLGACIVLVHPLKPGEIAVSIRRCLFGYPFP